MKKLIIIPLLFILLSVQGQNGRYPFYRGTGVSAYPSVLDDGYTEVWADMYSAVPDENDSVSLWEDKSGNNRDITDSGIDSHRAFLTEDGVYFGTVGSTMETDVEVSQPFTIYLVATIHSFTNNDILMFFRPDGTLYIKQSGWDENPAGYGLQYFADGTYLTKYGTTLDTPHVFVFEFNTTESSLTWDNITATTGSINNIATQTLEFGYNTITVDMTVQEVMMRSKIDDPEDKTEIINYLDDRWDTAY